MDKKIKERLIRLGHSYKNVEKQVGIRLEKIPHYYFWIHFGLLPSLLAMFWYLQEHPNFLANLTGADWIAAFVVLTFAVMSGFVTLSMSITVGAILIYLTVTKARQNDWKSALINKVRTLLPLRQYTEDELKELIGNEFERVMKKFKMIPNKPTNEAFTEIFRDLAELKQSKKSSNIPQYPCSNCGKMFDAPNPDPFFTVFMRKKCEICDILGLEMYVTQNFDCSSCGTRNGCYFHDKNLHSKTEIRLAGKIPFERDEL